MYSCLQCVMQGLPSHHTTVHVQYDDTYTEQLSTESATVQGTLPSYVLKHTNTCPQGHLLTSALLQVEKQDAEQLKGTKVIQRA